MGYVVLTKGRNNMFLFLIDRTKTKKCWWSYDLHDVMIFHKHSAAQIQASKLKFKSPEVITIEEAKRLSAQNDRNYPYEYYEHPFSSEALGQD